MSLSSSSGKQNCRGNPPKHLRYRKYIQKKRIDPRIDTAGNFGISYFFRVHNFCHIYDIIFEVKIVKVVK